MMANKLDIMSASILADQLLALTEHLYMHGSNRGLKPNDDLIGIAYDHVIKLQDFLHEEEIRQEITELDKCKGEITPELHAKLCAATKRGQQNARHD